MLIVKDNSDPIYEIDGQRSILSLKNLSFVSSLISLVEFRCRLKSEYTTPNL